MRMFLSLSLVMALTITMVSSTSLNPSSIQSELYNFNTQFYSGKIVANASCIASIYSKLKICYKVNNMPYTINPTTLNYSVISYDKTTFCQSYEVYLYCIQTKASKACHNIEYVPYKMPGFCTEFASSSLFRKSIVLSVIPILVTLMIIVMVLRYFCHESVDRLLTC